MSFYCVIQTLNWKKDLSNFTYHLKKVQQAFKIPAKYLKITNFHKLAATVLKLKCPKQKTKIQNLPRLEKIPK